MLLKGKNVRTDSILTDSGISIYQLITFSSIKQRQRNIKAEEQIIRCHFNQKIPLAVYLAIALQSWKMYKKGIDYFHSLGLSISHDLYLHLSDYIIDTICQIFEVQRVLCPALLKKCIHCSCWAQYRCTISTVILWIYFISLFAEPITKEKSVLKLFLNAKIFAWD